MEQELQDLHYLEVIINGEPVALWVEPGETLLEVLRERLQLLGTKAGCERGECGACTVLLNQEPIYACLLLAVQAHQAEITTIEGVQGPNGDLHDIQRAFIEHNAVQCGFCTPGVILTVLALLNKHPSPNNQQLQTALEGHLCRCGAYPSIMKAIKALQKESHADAI